MMKVVQQLACAAVCCMPLVACAFHDGPIDSKVIDADTGKPIAGATVLATWERYEGVVGAGSSMCRHVETAVTDAKGRYHIKRWGYIRNPVELLYSTNFIVMLKAFKAGFVDVPYPTIVDLNKITGELILMAFKGTLKERCMIWCAYHFSQVARE